MNYFIKYQNFNVYIKRSTPFLVPDTNSIFFRFFVRDVSGYHKKFRGTNSRFLKHKVLVHISKDSILKNFSVIFTGTLCFKNLLFKPRNFLWYPIHLERKIIIN